MEKSCKNCKYRSRLIKLDFRTEMSDRMEYDGFACTEFRGERVVYHLVGIEPEPNMISECFSPRNK